MAFNTWDIVSSYNNNTNVPYSVYQQANDPVRHVRTQKSFLDNTLNGNDKLDRFLNLMSQRLYDSTSTQSASSTSTSSTDDEDDNVQLESVYNLGTQSVEEDEGTNDDNKKKEQTLKYNTASQYYNMPLDKLLQVTGLDSIVNITSHTRSDKHNAEVGGAQHSWHLQSRASASGHMGAYDIVPKNGDFKQMFDALTSNEAFVEWAKANNYNINDETNRSGYGAHLHLAPDWFVAGSTKYRKKYTS